MATDLKIAVGFMSSSTFGLNEVLKIFFLINSLPLRPTTPFIDKKQIIQSTTRTVKKSLAHQLGWPHTIIKSRIKQNDEILWRTTIEESFLLGALKVMKNVGTGRLHCNELIN